MNSVSVENFLDTPTHHAYLIIGDSAIHFEKSRLHVREKISVGEFNAADVWSRTYESVGIDDAREIKEIQTTMPVGSRRIVLISLEAIQNEAQNSLLKLFEEASVHTTFFIFARTTEIFLPTVLSRFNIITLGTGGVKNEKKTTNGGVGAGEPGSTDVHIRTFLSSTVAGRMEILEPIITDKDKGLAESFLNKLELTLNNVKTFKMSPVAPAIFEDIFSARRFLRSRSPSVKMILEHVSGVIPLFSK